MLRILLICFHFLYLYYKKSIFRTMQSYFSKFTNIFCCNMLNLWVLYINFNLLVSFFFFLSFLLQRSTASVIPAVEVEAPGCSFNPPFEAHQVCFVIYVPDLAMLPMF